MKSQWTADDVPALTGRVAIVTGANSGLGLETARALARRGAQVILACRDTTKASRAEQEIAAAAGREGTVLALPLDLASLASVRAFAQSFQQRFQSLDLLVLNAGVTAIPQRRTADGFEMQLGTNHLGHFALGGLLLDVLLATPDSRVVTVSSSAHRIGRIDFDDLHGERRYGPWRAYGQSKLANLLYTFELQRRLLQRGAETIAVAAHPGYAATQLQERGPRERNAALMTRLVAIGNRILAQSAAMGALPVLYAATAPDVRGGDYFGPSRGFELWGPPRRVGATTRARNEGVAKRLWSVSEELTGVHYGALERPLPRPRRGAPRLAGGGRRSPERNDRRPHRAPPRASRDATGSLRAGRDRVGHRSRGFPSRSPARQSANRACRADACRRASAWPRSTSSAVRQRSKSR